MGRIAARVSKKEFESLWAAACSSVEDIDITKNEHYGCGQWVKDVGKIDPDIAKVHFDWENSSWLSPPDVSPFSQAWMEPPHVFTNEDGLTFIGVSAGGDWEYPVSFIIYLDQNGTTFRGYVPKIGNPWNHDTKQAFGNDEDADTKFLLKWMKKNKKIDKQEEFELDEDNYLTSEDADVMEDEAAMMQEIKDHIKVKA